MTDVPRALRSVVGPTVRSATVALAALISLIAYLFTSKAVTMMANVWVYLDSVIGSFVTSGHARAFAFRFAPSFGALATFLVFVASCVGIGVLVAQSLRGSRAALPMAWVSALAATVVPTLAIAMVRWPDGGGSLTNPMICAAQLILVALVWLWSRRPRTIASTPHDRIPDALTDAPTDAPTEATSKVVWFFSALAACYAVVILIDGFSLIQGYDSFSDHLAVPARWLVQGRIEHGTPEELVTFYPGNFELLVRWTLSLGTDRLAFLLSYGSSVAAVWVVYRIAREIGQSQVAAQLSALTAASLQVLAYQSVVVYSDSYTALCLLLATWLLLIWARDGAKDDRLTLGFGLAIGMALGSKYSAGPPVIVLGIAWLYYAWRASWELDKTGLDRLQWLRLARTLTIVIIATLSTMAYWYLRNGIEQHNPLFPLSVAGMPGLNITDLLANAPGPRTFFERLTFPWTEVGHISAYETGLGPIFASVALVAIGALPFAPRREGSMQRLTWLILLGASFAWWRTGVLVPRYGLFPLLLSFVFVGELWTAFASRLLGIVIGATVIMTMVSVGHEILGIAGYHELTFDATPPVPAVIESLPASRILNAAGEPSGYYAMGHDYRHRVTTLFRDATPADVRRLAPEFVLLTQAREAEFVAPLGLELMGRWERQGSPSTSLWRVTAPPSVPAR